MTPGSGGCVPEIRGEQIHEPGLATFGRAPHPKSYTTATSTRTVGTKAGTALNLPTLWRCKHIGRDTAHMRDSFIHPFSQLCEFRLVVCTICQYTCVTKEARNRLRAWHIDVPQAQQQAIAQAIQQLDVVQDQAGLAGFQFPPTSHTPIPDLQPPRTDGRQCRTCLYITYDPRRIRAHCRQQHQWENPQGKGRLAKSTANGVETRPWRELVWCQRFFHSRITASRWFEVSHTPGFRPTTPPARPSLQRAYSYAQPRTSLANLAFIHQVCQQETEASTQRPARASTLYKGLTTWLPSVRYGALS